MAYFWWGWQARRGDSALLDAQRQISAHVQGIADAVTRAERLDKERLAFTLRGRAAGMICSAGLGSVEQVAEPGPAGQIRCRGS